MATTVLVRTAAGLHTPASAVSNASVVIPPPALPQQPSADVKPPANFNAAAAAAAAVPAPPPPSSSEHSFLSSETKPGLSTAQAAGAILNMNGRREREVSPPHSLPNSQPPTRESSPCPTPSSSSVSSGNNSRTPPPKRWKRSFDMTQPPHSSSTPKTASSAGVVNPPSAIKECPEQQEPLPMVRESIPTAHIENAVRLSTCFLYVFLGGGKLLHFSSRL